MNGMREHRESLGLTQLEVAFKADVSVTTVQGLEAGTLRPTPKTRKKLAAAYGVTVADIERACGIEPSKLRMADTLSAA